MGSPWLQNPKIRRSDRITFGPRAWVALGNLREQTQVVTTVSNLSSRKFMTQCPFLKEKQKKRRKKKEKKDTP